MTSKQTPEKIRILIVDDIPETLEILRRQLCAAGFITSVAPGVAEAIGILEFNPVDLVITDMKMPRLTGLDMVRYIRENAAETEVIIMTAFPCIDNAIQSVKDGAEDYLTKPFTGDELLAAIERVREKILLRRSARMDAPPSESYGIIGESTAMRTVYSLIDKAAPILVNVLISGESGTGKELVARAIHYGGDRASAPFVSVNCTAIPDTLIESELFGHVKGAFTGAKENRTGFFQIADGGTLFLDEIGDASPNLQGKLLRVLQNKEILLVGSSRVRKVDTRVIAATHKNLQALVAKGLFREDLFYRLNVIDIPVPPLRDRENDVMILMNYFLNKFSKEMHRPAPRFSDNALHAILHYRWPGNVRELENMVQRIMVVVDEDLIDVVDLPRDMRGHVPSKTWTARSLAEVEAEHIAHVLAEVEGNKTRAAEILGIDRKTLRQKLTQTSDKKGRSGE
ncbi:sigma-54-dependent transcriptional regulator [Desulfococcus sp.]|uniref:sigma-54-dependent transcriptional regulator n=1 Tax=Desulfococcus sp. TaxID=2025834 RepID=UPI003593FED1